MRGTPQPDMKPAPIGAGANADKPRPVGTPQGPDPRSQGQTLNQPATSGAAAPTPPVESKPTPAEVKATADSLAAKPAAPAPSNNGKSIPAGPKNSRVTPAVPIPTAILSKPGPQATAAAAAVKSSADPSNGPSNTVSLKDATQAAKEAVAVAMAKLNNQAASATKSEAPPPGKDSATLNSVQMDNLTKKVQEMRVNAATGRGRGRGGRSRGPNKINVPDSDFDFETANAKFSKQDLAKEAVQSGSPLAESANGTPSEIQEPEDPTAVPAYNKTKSFFDNISSEAKERAENGGQKPGGREWRGEEQRKNMETFGQGSVDGGYRGGYRGRGRGRGRGGRGYGPRTRGGYRQSTPQ